MLGSFTPKNLVYRQAIGFGSLVRGVLGNVLGQTTVAYFAKVQIMAQKSFITFAPVLIKGKGDWTVCKERFSFHHLKFTMKKKVLRLFS